MKFAIKQGAALAALTVLASCSAFDGQDSRPETTSETSVKPTQAAVSDTPVKFGTPYTVGDRNYTPNDIINYDEVGYASYYGAELAGKPTANGEVFNPSGVTAAHKTLPMPSYVEVTALDTGRTILVRINDRGPFANDRLIDLSEGAARQLGITNQGVAGVRVRRVNPPEQERAVLRQGMPAAERIETPPSLLKVLRDNLAKLPAPTGKVTVPAATAAATPPAKPTGKPAAKPTSPQATAKNDGFVREGGASTSKSKPAPVATSSATPKPTPAPTTTATSGGYMVQFGAFSSRSSADALAKRANAKVYTSGKLHRVRSGPFATQAEADREAAAARKRGLTASVLRN